MYARGLHFARFYDFSIRFWNCSDSVVIFCISLFSSVIQYTQGMTIYLEGGGGMVFFVKKYSDFGGGKNQYKSSLWYTR